MSPSRSAFALCLRQHLCADVNPRNMLAIPCESNRIPSRARSGVKNIVETDIAQQRHDHDFFDSSNLRARSRRVVLVVGCAAQIVTSFNLAVLRLDFRLHQNMAPIAFHPLRLFISYCPAGRVEGIRI